MDKRAKSTQPQPNLPSEIFYAAECENASRTRSPGGRSPSGRMSRPAVQGSPQRKVAPLQFCVEWHPPECLFYKTKGGCRFGESARMHIARLMNSLAKGLKRLVTKVQWPCGRSMSRTIERWNPLFAVTRVTCAMGLLCATHQIHDNWVVYSRIWSRRSLHRFYGRAQTYGIQSDVFVSHKPSDVMLTFETEIRRLEWFAQVIFTSVTPVLQKLRIGLRKRRNGKERCAREAAFKINEKDKAVFFLLSENWCLLASNFKPEVREFVCRLRSVDAHDQQKELDLCWNGYFDDVEKTYGQS